MLNTAKLWDLLRERASEIRARRATDKDMLELIAVELAAQMVGCSADEEVTFDRAQRAFLDHVNVGAVALAANGLKLGPRWKKLADRKAVMNCLDPDSLLSLAANDPGMRELVKKRLAN